MTTAAYLGRAGKKVLVLEKRYVLGGAAVTEEVFWKRLKNLQTLLSQRLLVKKIQRNLFVQLLASGLVLFYSPFQKKTNNLF